MKPNIHSHLERSQCYLLGYLYVTSLVGVRLGVEDTKNARKPFSQGLFQFWMLGVGEKRSLSVHDITVRPWWHYGSPPTSRNLVIYSQCGNVLFPGWEYFIPKVGIICAVPLLNKQPLMKNKGSLLDHRCHLLCVASISPITPSEVLWQKAFVGFILVGSEP